MTWGQGVGLILVLLGMINSAPWLLVWGAILILAGTLTGPVR